MSNKVKANILRASLSSIITLGNLMLVRSGAAIMTARLPLKTCEHWEETWSYRFGVLTCSGTLTAWTPLVAWIDISRSRVSSSIESQTSSITYGRMVSITGSRMSSGITDNHTSSNI